MVASNRHRDLYWFRPEPYVQSQRLSSTCFLLECSKVLTMGGARKVEEMEGPMLGERLPEEKLKEPYYNGE